MHNVSCCTLYSVTLTSFHTEVGLIPHPLNLGGFVAAQRKQCFAISKPSHHKYSSFL